MVHVPAARFALGTDLDGIVSAAEQCSQTSLDPCGIEPFSDELTSAMPTTVAPFWLDRTEVSQAEYSRCQRAGSCPAMRVTHATEALLGPDLPAILISQEAAQAYCRFRGARLPTEAEWEAAAGGQGKRRYPWGELFHAGRANIGKSREPYTDRQDGFELLAPVEAFDAGKTPLGILQMAGNVSEWTATLFAGHSPESAPPQSGFYVVKGGSFVDPPVMQRVTKRSMRKGTDVSVSIGFRCARSLKP